MFYTCGQLHKLNEIVHLRSTLSNSMSAFHTIGWIILLRLNMQCGRMWCFQRILLGWDFAALRAHIPPSGVQQQRKPFADGYEGQYRVGFSWIGQQHVGGVNRTNGVEKIKGLRKLLGDLLSWDWTKEILLEFLYFLAPTRTLVCSV